MSCCRSFALFCSLAGWSWGCEQAPPAEKRSEPWPAPAVSSARAPASALVDYELESRQRIDFELQTRSTKIVGFFPVVRGKLELDLLHLERTRGTVEVDLGAVRITAGDERDEREQSATAMNWLNLGSSIPEATRSGRRWASFEISEIFQVSAQAAHEGRVQPREENAGRGETDADTGASAGESRQVLAKVRGPFSMNQRRTSQDLNVSISFDYSAAATPGFPPATLRVESARALGIPLEAFGVEPRNAVGVVIASDRKLLGSTVGRVAKVSFVLTFRHQPGAR
jgi:hypothetical protein